MRKLLLAGIAACSVATAPVLGADLPDAAPAYRPPIPPAWVWEFGARYWYSSGKNWYNYYTDPTPTQLASRLSYQGSAGHSGEVFFRVDSFYGPMQGIFMKGYIGGGSITKGTLIDEDFPPGVVPYSSTTSNANGNLTYASIDVGYTFFDNTWRGQGTYKSGAAEPSAGVRFGAVVGYHYWNEIADAYGCTQTGANFGICVPAIPTAFKVITEEDNWNSLRVGLTGDLLLTPRLKLSGEAAFVWATQKALDTHYFTFGPDPATGRGTGFQTEAILSYQITDAFNFGVGARWWHLKTNATDSFDQLLQYTTDRYGAFVQGSLKFGD